MVVIVSWSQMVTLDHIWSQTVLVLVIYSDCCNLL